MILSIRPAVETDLDELSRFAAGTFPLACPPDLARDAIEAFVRENLSLESFRGHLRDPAHTVLVGTGPDHRLMAYALLVDGTTMDEDCAGMITGRPTIGISKFYLDPALHGAGAAAQLLEAVVSHARDAGAVGLWLATNVGNDRARGFYEKTGFRERGTRVFMVGGVRNHDVVLELTL